MQFTKTMIITATALLLGTGAGVSSASQDAASAQVLSTLKRAYPATTFTSVGPSALPGVYEVVMGRNVAYTDSSGRYFLFGNLMDMQTQANLTQERSDSLQRIDVGSLPVENALKTVRGTGAQVLYVFSDPSCGYCKQLEPTLNSMDNITIYTFIVPILGQASTAAGANIWCAKDRNKAWSSHMTGGTKAGTAAPGCDHPMRRNLQMAEKLGIAGTPTLVNAQGVRTVGAVSSAQLRALLEPAASVASTPARSAP
jgi:thiol:disulfide interchange protein DsbC